MARAFSVGNAFRRALPSISLAVAVFIAALAAWALVVTGGDGAVLTAVAVAALGCAWSLRPLFVLRKQRAARLAEEETSWQRDLRTVWAVSKSLVVTLMVWTAVSVGMYLSHDTGDPLQQQLAAWGRNHGLGPIIDYLEAQTYDEPPSKDPAKELSLSVSGAPTTSTTEPVTDGSAPVDTGPTTTVDPGPQAPEPLETFFEPALAGEGEWTVIANAGGYPALWATSIRPYREAGGVVGSIVVIDQTHLRAGMFNGSEEPGGEWVRDDRVPEELYASLVAAMNGGFRFEHVKGGYVTEGRVVKALRDGDATLGVRKSDGKLVLGMLGRDLMDDGTWLSLRQNLTLMVDGSTSKVAEGTAAGTFWGANYGKDVYVNRSAVCQMEDGRLAYMIIGLVSAEQMAQSMISIGCTMGIQMDINGTWPNFFTFEHNPDGGVKPIFLDNRMGSNTYRYIKGSTKEFFAFFDVTLVPPGSVLEA